MVVMDTCPKCKATIPRGITVEDKSGSRMTAVTNYCPICGEPTAWGEEYNE